MLDKRVLGAGSLYVSLLRKLNEQLIVKYQDWLRERWLEGNVRSLHAFCERQSLKLDGCIRDCQRLRTAEGKAISTGRTLAVTQVSLKKNNVLAKCKLCLNEHGLWQCSQFKALPGEKRWDEARELRAGVVQLMDGVPTIIVCYTTGYRKWH